MAAAILACKGCVGHVRGTSLALCALCATKRGLTKISIADNAEIYGSGFLLSEVRTQWQLRQM